MVKLGRNPIDPILKEGDRMERSLGDRIRQARETHGLSQADMSRDLQASVNAINMLEVGRIADPHLSRMIKIAELCGVSLDYLAGLTDDPTPPRRRRRAKPAAATDDAADEGEAA